jgi:putative ABC transport system permease protein
MNTVSRGIRNAFRNLTRTVSIVIILGLSMGLALTMLLAHKAVSDKINSVKASVGNTVTIAPAGFSGFSQVNNSLTTSELSSVKSLANVSSVQESLSDRLTTNGSTQPSFGGGGGSSSTTSSNDKTSLTSPVTLNTSSGGGGHFFVSGGGSLPTSFSLPVEIVGTNDTSEVDSTAIDITSGKTIDGNTDTDSALVSSSMATKNDLKVGSTFTAYGTTMTVAGIFSSSSTNSTKSTDDTVIVALPTEQRLSGQTGDVTSALATINSVDNLTSATSAIKAKLGTKADVTSSVQEAESTVQPLNSVKSISIYSLIGAVIAGSVIILLTMVMIVRERTKEIGVFKAIGASNVKVALQFMSEAVTLTVIGAVVGIILGAVAANPITKTLVSSSTTSTSTTTSGFSGGMGAAGGGFGGGGGGGRFIERHGAGGLVKSDFHNIHAAVGFSIIIYGLLAAVIIAVVGSAAVSYFIAKIRPAEVIRTE